MSFEIDPSFVTVACDEYCLKVADGTHDSPKQTSNGKLLVTSKNVKDGRLLLDSAYFISDEDYAEINRRSKVDQWDLLLTMIGTVGETCIVSQSDPIFAIKNVGLLKCGTELRAKWLYYLLRSPQGQQLIEQRKKGSTQQYISLTEIRNFPVSYPSNELEMQGAVSVLSLLDDRITLLRETNATLEAIAQALFKSWFVDFDPVRAKAEGRARQDGERSGQPRMPQASDLPRPGAEAGSEAQGQPEGAIQGSMSAAEGTTAGMPEVGQRREQLPRMPKAAMDATTAALFPDSFEESELGLVPKGWAIGCVGDLASQKKGSVNPFASPEVLFEHYSLPAFDSGQTPVIELGQEIKSNKTPLPEEAVLLSKLNPHIPRVWLPVFYGPNAVCSTEFLAYSPQEGASKEFIYCLFSSESFQLQLCQLVTGTSNSHQRVKPDQVLAVKLPIADRSVLKAFAELAKPLFERVHANRQQAQTLTQLRDTLLPRLISGQLRLPEAEATVEEVL